MKECCGQKAVYGLKDSIALTSAALWLSVLLQAISMGCQKNDYRTSAATPTAQAASEIEKMAREVIFECPMGNCEMVASIGLVLTSDTSESRQTAKVARTSHGRSSCTGFLSLNSNRVYTSPECIPEAVKKGEVPCSEAIAIAFPGRNATQGIVRACRSLVSSTRSKAVTDDPDQRPPMRNSGLRTEPKADLAILSIDPLDRRPILSQYSTVANLVDRASLTVAYPVYDSEKQVANFEMQTCVLAQESLLAPALGSTRPLEQVGVAAPNIGPCAVSAEGQFGAPVFMVEGGQSKPIGITQGQRDTLTLLKQLNPEFRILRGSEALNPSTALPNHVLFGYLGCFDTYSLSPNLDLTYCPGPVRQSAQNATTIGASLFVDQIFEDEKKVLSNRVIPAARELQMARFRKDVEAQTSLYFDFEISRDGLNFFIQPTCVRQTLTDKIIQTQRDHTTQAILSSRTFNLAALVDESLTPLSWDMIEAATDSYTFTYSVPLAAAFRGGESLKANLPEEPRGPNQPLALSSLRRPVKDIPKCRLN